jgi:hypothetical protein
MAHATSSFPRRSGQQRRPPHDGEHAGAACPCPNACLPTQSDAKQAREHGALNGDPTVSNHRRKKLDHHAKRLGADARSSTSNPKHPDLMGTCTTLNGDDGQTQSRRHRDTSVDTLSTPCSQRLSAASNWWTEGRGSQCYDLRRWRRSGPPLVLSLREPRVHGAYP